MLSEIYIPGGEYRVLKVLGKGGAGLVLLTEHVNLGERRAVKRIDKKMKEMLPSEISILKKVDHPSLPHVFDVLEDAGYIYIIEEFIDGITIEDKLKKEGPFSQGQVVDWGIELCGVLEYLHSFRPNPIIYRDLKPSNIMLSKEGKLRLLDFGTAREYKEQNGMDTVFIGTRGYAAPEQYGSGQTGPAADIYSFGVTLYHLATGLGPNEPPFEIQPVTTVSEGYSYEFEKIISRCTRLDPQKRYQKVSDLRRDLEEIRRGMNKADDPAVHTADRACGRARGFKRTVLCVWGNTEFACELAYICGKITEYRVLLVDLDLLSPRADLYLNIKKYPQTGFQSGLLGKSGLNLVMDTIETGRRDPSIIEESCVKRQDNRNLHVLTGSYNIEDYEYYSQEALNELIELAYRNFDITVLAVSSFIYDLYTFISLARSDYNIAAVPACTDALREVNNYLFFLQSKQHIPANKTKFVAYDYQENIHLGPAALRDITEDNYIGSIRWDNRKARCRSLRKPYVTKISREMLDDYRRVLKYFDIVQYSPVGSGIKNMFRRGIRRKYPFLSPGMGRAGD